MDELYSKYMLFGVARIKDAYYDLIGEFRNLISNIKFQISNLE